MKTGNRKLPQSAILNNTWTFKMSKKRTPHTSIIITISQEEFPLKNISSFCRKVPVQESARSIAQLSTSLTAFSAR